MQFHTACKCQPSIAFIRESIYEKVAMQFHTACKCQLCGRPVYLEGRVVLQCNFTPLASANLLYDKLFGVCHPCCNAISHRLQVPTCAIMMIPVGKHSSCNAISHRLQVPTLSLPDSNLPPYNCCNAISHRLQVPTMLFSNHQRSSRWLQCNFTPLASAN